MYSLPQTVTIPLLEIPVSMSTLIGLALLIILFFTFFSVSFKLGGGLSAASVAKTENKCDEGPTSFEQTGLALFSSVDSDLRTGITSFERDFMSGGKTGSAQGSSVGVTSGRTADSLWDDVWGGGSSTSSSKGSHAAHSKHSAKSSSGGSSSGSSSSSDSGSSSSSSSSWTQDVADVF